MKHPMQSVKKMTRFLSTRGHLYLDSTRGAYIEEIVKETSSGLPKSTLSAAVVAGATAALIAGPVHRPGLYHGTANEDQGAKFKNQEREAAAIRKAEDIIRALESEQNEIELQKEASLFNSDGHMCDPQHLPKRPQKPVPDRKPVPGRKPHNSQTEPESELGCGYFDYQRLSPVVGFDGRMCDPRSFQKQLPQSSPRPTRKMSKEDIEFHWQHNFQRLTPFGDGPGSMCDPQLFSMPRPLDSHPRDGPGFGEPGWKPSHSFVRSVKEEGSGSDKGHDEDKAKDKDNKPSDKGRRKSLAAKKSLRSLRSKFLEHETE